MAPTTITTTIPKAIPPTTIIQDKCQDCGTCAEKCPKKVIEEL